MATFDTNRTSFGSTTVAAPIFGFAHRAIAAIACWNDVRVTRNTLSALSNRELEDIGLTRGDIDLMSRS
jgi:uncharacterized protein YjiS (DUF1127 family)